MSTRVAGSAGAPWVRVAIATLALCTLVACRSPTPDAGPTQPPEASADLTRLAALYTERASAAPQDYPIGPGDLIEISVPAMPEIGRLEARVGTNGELALPLVGRLQAGGRTESELHDALGLALGEYMYEPEFSLLVKQHRNRQVGVLGAVAQPGLHPLDGPGDTVLDLLSKAGGLTDEATRRLLFLPRIEAPSSALPPVAAPSPSPSPSPSPTGASPIESFDKPSIVIDLDRIDRPEQQLALSIPLRPGDTLMALGGGKVFLRGWVKQPGALEMSRGLTVLGAITEAGGFAFPAKPSAVRILREEPGSDTRAVLEVDLERVEAGGGEDLRMREGDIVEVNAAAGKLALYGAYRFITGLINVGLSLSPL
jgi:polysaccharide export outer membrane protein